MKSTKNLGNKNTQWILVREKSDVLLDNSPLYPYTLWLNYVNSLIFKLSEHRAFLKDKKSYQQWSIIWLNVVYG